MVDDRILTRASLIALPIVSLMVCCAGPEPQGRPESTPDTTTFVAAQRQQPSVPAPLDTLPSGYTLTDTTAWDAFEEAGQRGVLRRGGVAIDTVDLTYGVTAVGEDSLIFLPVRTDTVPELPNAKLLPSAASLTDYTFWTPTARHRLRDLLPFFDSFLSSPTKPRDGVIHYWGIALQRPTNRIYAMRYDFRAARLDSIFLNREDALATDYRYHFGTPQIRGDVVSFDRLIVDRATWRLIRQDSVSH